jgi:integrase
MSEKQAEAERDKIVLPLQAGDKTDKLRTLVHRLTDAEQEQAVAIEAARDKLGLSDAWDVYLASPERPDSGDTTLRQYEFQWCRLAVWATGQGITLLSEVTPEHGKRYAQDLFGSDLAASTANKHIRLCRLVFSVLAEQERMIANPFATIRSRKEQSNRRLEFSWDKLTEICDAAEGELKTLLFIGIYTGQRLEDCVTLRWQDVDLQQGWIRFVPAKMKRRSSDPIHVPVLPDLRGMLEATVPSKRKGYVLPELADFYARDRRDTVTDRIQRLLVNCGVELYEPGTGPGTGKRAVPRYGFHSLRHTTITLLLQAGVPPAVVQAITGHRTNAMMARYTHVGRESIQKAMATLPSMSGDGKPQMLPEPASDANGVADAAAILEELLSEGRAPRDWRNRIQRAVDALQGGSAR